MVEHLIANNVYMVSAQEPMSVLMVQEKGTATLCSSEVFSYGFIGFISVDVQIIATYLDSRSQVKCEILPSKIDNAA